VLNSTEKPKAVSKWRQIYFIFIMSREVKQVVETSNEAGDKGTITVITKDDYGREYASTREYDYWTSKAEATEKATQDSLNK